MPIKTRASTSGHVRAGSGGTGILYASQRSARSGRRDTANRACRRRARLGAGCAGGRRVGTVGTVTGPAAEGARVAWEQVPFGVRAAIEDVCGSRVVAAWTQPGGFSPGLAARVRCADGARFFVKAVSAQANPDTPRLHRQEGRVLAALEPLIAGRQLPIPRLHGIVDRKPWIALILQDVDGRQPALPAAERLGGAFTGWRTLAATPDRGQLDPWSRAHLDRLAQIEATWAGHATGDTLLHADIRADNLLLTGHGPVVVDWPWACQGAAVFDLILFAPSVAMQGGPPPADLLARSRHGRAARRDTVTALVCGLAGYLTERSLRPPPLGLPTVRSFQAAQGAVARRWLAGLI